MSSEQIQPRVDEHGVPWCQRECRHCTPYQKAGSPSFPLWRCQITRENCYPDQTPMGFCQPAVRALAADNAALRAERDRLAAIEERAKSVADSTADPNPPIKIGRNIACYHQAGRTARYILTGTVDTHGS